MLSQGEKLIIGVLAVVAILGAVYILTSTPEDEDVKKAPTEDRADLRFDLYSEVIDTSFDVIGEPTYPDEGMKYILLHFRLANDTVSEGITLHPKYTVWTVVSDGVGYNQDWTTYTHPDLTHASKLMMGGQIDDIRVFQIPEGDDVDSIYFNINVYGLSEKISIQMDESLL